MEWIIAHFSVLMNGFGVIVAFMLLTKTNKALDKITDVMAVGCKSFIEILSKLHDTCDSNNKMLTRLDVYLDVVNRIKNKINGGNGKNGVEGKGAPIQEDKL